MIFNFLCIVVFKFWVENKNLLFLEIDIICVFGCISVVEIVYGNVILSVCILLLNNRCCGL